MPNFDPQPGDVYYYPYVWERQLNAVLPYDVVEAEKERPCCVTLRLPRPIMGYDTYMLAISKSGYPVGGSGIEIPSGEIRRLTGLDPNVRRWLTTSEYNSTVHTFDAFSQMEYRGRFSPSFMKNKVVPQVRGMLSMSIERMKAGK